MNLGQPATGRRIYVEQQCALCHGESLKGSPGGPALADAGFRDAWRGRPVAALLDCLKTTMPPGRAGTLPDADYLHLLSVLLEANGLQGKDGPDAQLLDGGR